MWEDLTKRVKQLKESGYELIILMDANDSLQQSNSSLKDFVKTCELDDIISKRHGTKDDPPTHNRGKQRIDYILITPTLSAYVSACGILPFNDICSSDHRAIYADIDIKGYLQGDR